MLFRSILFTLDSRQIEAEIKRVQAVIAGAEAQLDQAQRDVQRYTDLVAKNATTQVTLNNAQTQVNVARALAESCGKRTVAGSDAHTYRGIGRTWVDAPDASTREEFMTALRAGRVTVGGGHGHVLTMASDSLSL